MFLVAGFCACTIQNNVSKSADDMQIVQLNFQDCNFESDKKFIQLNVPRGYRLRRSSEYGFCEYWFVYKDESMLYVSSNTLAGSVLNYENRLNMGIKTYSVNRSKNDTIRNGGLQADSDHWAEWINGNYAIGYINAPDAVQFAATLNSVELIEAGQ